MQPPGGSAEASHQENSTAPCSWACADGVERAEPGTPKAIGTSPMCNCDIQTAPLSRKEGLCIQPSTGRQGPRCLWPFQGSSQEPELLPTSPHWASLMLAVSGKQKPQGLVHLHCCHCLLWAQGLSLQSCDRKGPWVVFQQVSPGWVGGDTSCP